MSALAIDMQALSYSWPDQEAPTLHQMDWHIQAGHFALVIGPSGSGKSTLLRTLNGLIPHFSGGRFGGDVAIHGLNTRTSTPRNLASHVGFVFQNPEAQLLTDNVTDDIVFGMEQLGTSVDVMRRRVEEVLDLLGIVHLRHRDPSTLSGGEKQRVAIATAMTLHPQVLVLDEPTSQLDPWSAETVFTALSRMNQNLGLTIVMSEHRLERVLPHADIVRVLAPGEPPIDGSPRVIAEHIDEIALPAVTRLGRMLQWRPLPLTIKDARTHEGFVDIAPQLDGVELSCPDIRPGAAILDAKGLTVKLGTTAVLRNLDISLHVGELLALMGRNGSGKTTLLRTIMGFVDAHGGVVELGHERTLGYVPQRAETLFFKDTLRAELEYTSRRRGITVDPLTLLADVGLEWAVDRHPATLSVGERQRAAIAVVLAGEPDILLLDEPTRGMDALAKHQLGHMLKRLQERGMGIMMATHDTELVAEIATTVALLGDGEIVDIGAPARVLSGSLTYSTQINTLFGGRWLTSDQIQRALAER